MGSIFSIFYPDAGSMSDNGGGQNLARAILTGTLVGAMVGLSGIPKRFIDALEMGDTLCRRFEKLAERAAGDLDCT